MSLPQLNHGNADRARDVWGEATLVREPQAHSQRTNAGATSALGLADLIAVARRRWWQCTVGGFLLGAVAAGSVWLLFKPVYEASAWLEVKDRRPHVVFEDTSNSARFSETQLQTIKSPVVLMKVSSQPEIAALRENDAKTTLEWLGKGLKASFLGRSELCQVSFRSYGAESSMKVANAIVDAYLSLHEDAYGQQVERIIELLVDEQKRRRSEVEALRENVRVLNKKATGHDGAPSSRTNELVVRESPLVGFEARRTDAEVERAVLQAKLQAYREAADAANLTIATSEIDEALDATVEVQSLQERLAVTRARLKDYEKRSRRGDNDPDRRRYRQEIEQIEQSLVEIREQLRPRTISSLQTSHAARHSQKIVDLQAEIKKQELLEQTWQARIDDHRSKLQAVGDDTLELEFARQELARAEEVFDKIGDRLIVLKTEKRAPPQAMALQRATSPEMPLEAVPYKKLGAAFFGGFFLPFGLALVWERSVRRISDVRELIAKGAPPVVGEITTLPTRWVAWGKASDQRYFRDRITFEESIDSLGIALMLSSSFRDVQALTVTSAVSGEGKTSLASSLAISLARRSRKPTLLIDADLRAPDLHDVFGTRLKPGMVEVLDQGVDIGKAIVTAVAPGVDLLPAGRLVKSSHATLRFDEFQALLAQLRTKYGYIVVDAPPVLSASEALLIAAGADGALVCAMRDVSRASQFQFACHKLTAAGAKLVGTVMSGVPMRSWAQKYGGYGYGWNRYLSHTSLGEETDDVVNTGLPVTEDASTDDDS